MINKNDYEPETSELPFILTYLDDIIGSDFLSEILSTTPQKYSQIVNELKNHTPYSTPFLQRVSKRDAPNYYDIIQNPMDLSAVSKKIKKYKNPTEFKKDLDLIWSNCLVYNGPGMYSTYAEKMREKSDVLFNNIFGPNNNKIEKIKKSVDNTNLISSENLNEQTNIENEQQAEIQYDKEVFSIPPKKINIQLVEPRSSHLMKKFVDSNETNPEIYFIKNTFPYKEVPKYVEETDLDLIKFDFHKISVTKSKSFMNSKEGLEWNDLKDKFMGLDTLCVKRLIEQINCIVLAKMGYLRVQKSALKIFTDIVYNFIFNKLVSLKSDCSGLLENDDNDNVSTQMMIEKFDIPNVFDYIFKSQEIDSDDVVDDVIVDANEFDDLIEEEEITEDNTFTKYIEE